MVPAQCSGVEGHWAPTSLVQPSPYCHSPSEATPR